MSIKKLFESTNKVDKFISDTNSKDAFNSEAESQFNIEQKTIDQERYVPQVDYSYPENFARYGSARLYYKSALTRISEFYPYDGSEGETNEFLNGCLDIERYILDNLYPRTNGYIVLNNAGHTTKVMQNGFGFPNSNEHIDLKGGPGVGRVTSGKLRDLLPNPKNSSYDYSNIYDENIYQTAGLPSDYGQGTRTSNLRSDFSDGVTLEFWLKTGSIDPLITQRQVVFDLWNNEHSSSDNYGRLTLEVTGANHAQPSTFRLSIASGSTVINSLPLGDFAVSQLGDWAHYAVVLSAQSASLYINGQRNNIATYGTATATITTTGGPLNDETFTLTDAAGLSVGFIFKHSVATVDGTKDGDNVIIGVDGALGSAAAVGERIRDAINASSLAMVAVEKTGPLRIELTQDDIGASGNTTVDMSGVTTVTATDFTGGKTLGALYEPNTIGRIGALVTNSIPASSGAERTGSAGSGRLSGSMDEFRFWKTARDAKQIGENWFTQVRGGANSDISNTTLGVYYKFNEGITGVNTTDNVVLDYAGRVTNGTWTGYNAGARNTGSAIVSASAATAEFLDPIIRTNHPSYVSLNTELLSTGSYHDGKNTNKLLSLLPSWILQENDENENFDLNYITHIMGTYFDKLYLQISDLPNLRHQTHTSGTFKPISFAEHLPQSLGLYSPEIFIDSTVLERFMNRSADGVFENELEEAKNLIYQNLYNNLAEIYKAKGTEQSIRNVLKCFNINENVLSLKVNSNNSEFILRNNLEQKLLRKNCANFNTEDNSTAVIYSRKQTSGIFDGSASEILGSVTGSTRQYGYGFTYEGNVIFPNFEPSVLKSAKLKEFNQVSLFGTVTTNNTTSASAGDDTTAMNATHDFGNFKIFAVRDTLKSTNAYFKLVVANPTGDDIILTSSVYNNIYNDEPWNLSVRVRPKNYPLSSFVNSSTHEGYDVIFTGFNPKTTDLFNSFILSASVSETLGKKYIESRKRAYVGANRVNVTGSITDKSDVLVSSVAYWLKSLDNTDLQQHSVDLENIGLSGSFRSLSALDTTDSSVEVLGRDTLAFNWNFRNVDSSDSSGNFVVEDFSSGSTDVINKFGWAGGISGFYYTGQGFDFANSSTSVVSRQSVNTYKFIDPERPISSDMVQIFSDSDDLTPNLRKEEIIPNYVYALEKSVYGAISEEMLDFFAGVVDFRSIIGAPVNYYRHRYKEMEKLRQTFFQRVSEVSTVEKYTEYYKWFDDALTTIISQLIPASGEYINDVQNVVESHVLERNKYQNRLNIFDSNMLPDIESSADSSDPGGDSYAEASSPEPSSPRPTNRHPLFWKKRADRKSIELRTGTSSAQVAIDTQRNNFRDIIYSNPVASGSLKKPLLITAGGTKYRLDNFAKRTQLQKFKFNININDGVFNKEKHGSVSPKVIRAGTNFEEVKNFDYFKSAVTPGGPINSEGGKFVPVNVLLGLVQDSIDLPYIVEPNRPAEVIVKRKKVFKVQHGRDYEDGIGFKNVKSSLGFPFNVISSSVEVNSGYNAEVVSRVGNYLMITNVHNDVYGGNFEVPMQGAFTRDVVGGLQYRHVRINTGSDQQNTRPEGFRIHLGTCPPSTEGAIGIVGPDYPPPNYNPPAGVRPYPYPHTPKAHMYRDLVAKRPVNIRNIVNNDGNVTVPGNFKENYQVIHSVGSFNNPRAFIDKQPVLPSQLSDVKFTTNVRTVLGIKRTNDSHTALVDEYSTSYLTGTTNKSILISRFSAPGGIEVMSKGYLDFKSSELSPYNSIPYRNLTVIKRTQGPSGSFSRPESDISGDTTDIQVSDIHNKDFGLLAHLARHSAKFGRDSVATEVIEYSLNKGMHVGYPNNTYNSNTPSGWWRLRTDVSSAGNITDSSGNGRTGLFDAAGDRPAFSTTLFPNSLIQEASCTFDGSDDAVNIGAGSLWQTIIGTGTGGTKKMTFAIWLRKTGDGGTGFGRIFGFGRDATNGQISIHTNGSEQIFFKTDWNGGTSNIWSTGASLFNLNTWTHLAITYDASSTTYDPIFYVNGVPVALISNPTPSGNWDGIASGQNCYIGNSSQGNKAFEGQLADAGIWNTILTADEIAALYRVGTLSNPDLITAISPAPPGETYTQLPSFHKINRNNLQRIQIAGYNNQFVDFYSTGSVKNNFFVQHQIPRSDRQYMWLSNSVQDASDIKYSGFQKVFNEELMPYRTSSSGLEFYWTFVQIADSRINGLSQSTNGLNILINDPLTESENTLGHASDTDVSNYMNAGFFVNPAARKAASTNYLNQLLTSRGNTYGWGWNKLRFNNNKILRNERTKNELTIATGSDQHLKTFRLAPVSLKGRDSYINFDVLVPTEANASTENVTLKFSNTNERIFFNELDLNNHAEINYSDISTPYKDAISTARSPRSTLNWFLYRQNIFPSNRNEFNTFVTKRIGYDNKYWRDSRTARAVLGNTLSSSLAGAPVSKSSWPLDAPQNFLTRTSIFGFSGSVFQPGFAGSPQYYIQQPFRPLSGSASYNKTVPAAGELQNTYFSYFTINLDGGIYTTMELAPLYNRKHTLGAPTSVVSPAGIKIPETGSFSASFDLSKQIDTFAGEALWEAADQAGIVVTTTSSSTEKILKRGKTSQFIASASNPWYNDYDDFKSDLKLMAKGYSIIPEYRMSEHVKDYFNFGINNKSKTNFFEIVGTNSSSVNNNFYKDYSNSDFLENFMGIKKESLLNAKEIKLTCNAAIKYNAYDGFYPAQRTVDLSAQFIDSFKNSIGGGQDGATTGLVTFNNQGFQQERGIPKNLAVPNLAVQRVAGLLKPALDPMFSPGILYNSIKAGLAVDYPMITNHRKRLRRPYGTIHTASTDNFAMTITGSSTVENFVSGSGQYIGGQFWDKRIPFEAIIEPTKYILNTNFCELESHPSMSVDCNRSRVHQGKDYNSCYEFEAVTASYDDNADGIYTLMARNFFGACGEFFLDGGEISKLESNTVLDDLQFSIDKSFSDLRPMYMARVKLRRSHNGARGYQFESDSFGNTGSAGYYGLKGAQRTINGTASSGQYPLPQDPMNNPVFQETFTMYSRPTAFGPPMAGRPTGSNANIMPFKSASKDSFSGYNPAFTPPYYDGEAWADLIFRPHVMNRETSMGGNLTSTPEVYDLNRILNETEVVCWRFDSGEEIKSGSSTLTASMPALIPVERTQLNNFLGQTPNNDRTVPSVYDGKRININSMQLTSSVQVFGTEKVLEQELDKFGNVVSNKNKSVGTKWIIQPKWETPMLNFNDKGVHPIAAVSGTLTLPTYGSASVPRGMWHQFGVIPEDPNTGVFLEIGDIPEDWLKNHYEVLTGDRVTPYNGGSIPRNGGQGSEIENTNRHNLYKNVRSLSTLCGFDKTNSRTRLGGIKQSMAVHEAVVAIPYIIEEIDEFENSTLPSDSKLRTERKKFISIPKKRFAATREEAAGSAAGDSLTVAGESIRKLRNALEKFVFPPELDFLNNKEVDPFAMYVFEFKYEFDRDDLSYIWQNLAPRDFEKVEFQNVSVAHNLANNELINEDVLANENLRWMVFKVKQRAQTDYFDLIADQANESTSKIDEKTTKLKDYKFGFNWPYDYLSFVELVKLDTEILFKK